MVALFYEKKVHGSRMGNNDGVNQRLLLANNGTVWHHGFQAVRGSNILHEMPNNYGPNGSPIICDRICPTVLFDFVSMCNEQYSEIAHDHFY